MMHLHARSAYSLLSSTLTIKRLVTTSKELGFSSCALTDYNVMFGAMEFFKECQKQDIKPIIGLEFKVKIHDSEVPFLLIAKNNKGYQDLMKLSSVVSSGDALPAEQVQTYSDNCFLIAYGEGGYLEPSLIVDDEKGLSILLNEMKQLLPPFDMAISYNETSFWKIKNVLLKKYCKQLGIKTLALSKIYYEKDEDALEFKVINGIREQKTINDKTLHLLKGRFIRTSKQMSELYDNDDLERTQEIADACYIDLAIPKTSLPSYKLPDGVEDSSQYLIQLCNAGLKKRMNGKPIPNTYMQRAKYELDIITKMHFEDYFLIVWDFIKYARKQGIYVGPGRGSAAGSLVAYCLGITHVDPLKYNLLFERFLNPERVSMPDIDTDFPDDRRDEVINYVYDAYGHDHIAHITTFGTLAAKQVIRDVGRVLEIPLRDIDMINKMIPQGIKVTLADAMNTSPRFKKTIEADARFEKLFNIALKLEGLPRHVSTHAAGIVMSKLPLEETVPVIQVEDGMVSTQYTMEHLEALGLIKMDFLGLRNLTIIDQIVQEVHNMDLTFDIMHIPLDDARTYQLIRKCDTVGIFQLESEGMKSLLKKMEPTRFEDVVATIALYRPGPMENIPLYLENKSHPESVHYLHPLLEPVLKDTYGVMIYQEQIMQTAQIMAGFSLGRADILRKAMAKKKESDLLSLQNEFIGGCIQNGHSEQLAKQLYNLVLKFAGYGFNKAHSVAYGLIAYQLAYLKANYPVAFYCALLNSVIGDDVKSSQYIDECRKHHVTVLYPSVNVANTNYIIENGTLRFPLLGIKNIGIAVVETIQQEREKGAFVDYYDFVARVAGAKCNRKCLEFLIDAGALDEFKINRKSMKASLDEALSYADLVRVETDGQIRIDLGLVSKPLAIVVKEDRIERSENEKEALGVILGAHPIIDVKQKYNINCDSLVQAMQKKQNMSSFVLINKVRQHRTKHGDMMAFMSVNDETSSIDLVVMPNVYRLVSQDLIKGNYIYFNGKMDKEDSCLVSSIKVLNRE